MYVFTIKYVSASDTIRTTPLLIMRKEMSTAIREAARREGFTLSNRWSKLNCIETLRKFNFISRSKNSTEIIPSGYFVVTDIKKV